MLLVPVFDYQIVFGKNVAPILIKKFLLKTLK